MAPLFASSDIAILIETFPPPSPTKEHPSLVKSRSGNNLLNSRTILKRFQDLFETRHDRIRRSDLASLLGVQKTDWLFDSYDGAVRFSRDKQSIIPDPQYQEILERFKARCREGFVDFNLFGAEEDIALELSDFYSPPHGLTGVQRFDIGGSPFFASDEFAEKTKRNIKSAISGAYSEKVCLNESLPDVPGVVLSCLTEEVNGQVADVGGHFEDGGDRIFFIPSTYEAAQEENRRIAHESILRDLVRRLEVDGFLEVHGEMAPENIFSRLEDADAAVILQLDNGTRTIALQTSVEEALKKLKADIAKFAFQRQPTNNLGFSSEMKTSIIKTSPNPDLASIILRSRHINDVKDALSSAIDEKDETDRQELHSLFQTIVMAPAHLYSVGAETVQDPTLKLHLNEYLSDYFHRNLIPHFLKTGRERGLIEADKTRTRDLDKFLQSSSQSKTMSDIRATAAKFAKKQKIDGPTSEQMDHVKQLDLQEKLAVVHKMTRGTDILQNAVWILLSARSEGLFVSAGKDTSRMIKHYQLAGGEEETGKKLERWRNMLKAGGKIDGMGVEEMRSLATRTVDEVCRREGVT